MCIALGLFVTTARVCNFSEQQQYISGDILTTVQRCAMKDLLSDGQLTGNENTLTLEPYQLSWWITDAK